MKPYPALITVSIGLLLNLEAYCADWPQFRYDAGRTAAAPHELPAELQLRWTRTLPAPRPAFPQELRLGFDASYEPIVLGDTMFVPSMVDDSLTALDTDSGKLRWRFMTDGPVRFAPAAWNDRVCVVSDDGYVYCLNATDGALRWKFRGLPEDRRDRKVLGNGRLISLWPARGGPVVADGLVYFAAGLWPTEGVFVYALDIETGTVIWSNTNSDHIKKANLDHGQEQVAGIMPQGYLAIVDDRLIVPCGTQLPAFFDLKTGERQSYTMGWGGRLGLPKGCWFVAGASKYLSHAGDLYDITRRNEERLSETKAGQTDFKHLLYPGGWTRLEIERSNQRELDWFCQPVMTPEVMYESGQRIVARDLTTYTLQKRTIENTPAYRAKDEFPDSFGGVLRKIWELPSKLGVHVKAGHCLYVGGKDAVEAIDVAGEEPKVVWRKEIEGTPSRMLVADQKLFIVTADGQILAYGAPAPGEPVHHLAPKAEPATADEWTARATAILEATGVRDGYALVLQFDTGRLVEELVRQSGLHVIAVDENVQKVAALRERLLNGGVYGTRASVHVGDPATYPFPPYMARLIVSETADIQAVFEDPSLVQVIFSVLRPYGGMACAGHQPGAAQRLEELVRERSLHGAHVERVGDLLLLTRTGPLPGAADWSHAEADAASTGASADQLRAPTKVLWFDAAQRWHKFPGQNQVRIAGGRLLLLENNLLCASDVYTGRKLWETDLSEKGQDLQRIRYTRHRQWGPKPSLLPTTQLVTVPDGIYLSSGSSCRVFDPATGKQTGIIDVPDNINTPWENLRVIENYLIGSSGRHVLCMDRRTCEEVWRAEANHAPLRLAVGGGRVTCAEQAKRSDGRIFALDLKTGKELWQRPGGGPVRYSPILDMAVTPQGFYRGANGEPLPWPADAAGRRLVITGNGLPKTGIPGYIAGEKLLTGSSDSLRVYDLRTAKPIGETLEWNRRGCTGTKASTHMLTVRYRGNAAWIDLDSRQITPILGIRPGCQVNNNLYPADGVLNIPNLTAGCTCNYLPVSMALVTREAIEPQ